MQSITEIECIVELGMIIGAAELLQQGKELFSSTDKKEEEDDADTHLSLMVPHPNFQRCMSYSRLEDLR
jgi:hypothetical protein